MMRIDCKCGAMIKDITDGQAHKAYMIGDAEWFALSEIKPPATLTPWGWRERARVILECYACGRLWVEERDRRKVRCYAPDNGAAPGLLFEAD